MRTLPMPDEVVEVLRAARKRQAEERLAFGAGYGPGEYVARDETGRLPQTGLDECLRPPRTCFEHGRAEITGRHRRRYPIEPIPAPAPHIATLLGWSKLT
jgi:hypothetical protein